VNKSKIYSLLLINTKKLNEISVESGLYSLTEEDNSFIFQILQNSQKALHTLNLTKFIDLDINFPNLTKLTLQISNYNCSINEFQIYFSRYFDKMENLDCVTLDIWGDWRPICEYIGKNYSKHCTSANYEEGMFTEILNCTPIQIVENIFLTELESTKYMSHVVYANIYVPNWDEDDTWNRYQEIFDQCTNLQAIEFTYYGTRRRHFITEVLPTLSESTKQKWNERISYFEKRTIRLADKNEIFGNQNLKKKLAKEAGISWRFHFE
jgi:hypothetical protein